jgi:hypothetical protein
VKLATSTRLELAVDRDAVLEEEVPGVRARAGQIRQLEKLPQANHLAADLDFLHPLILARRVDSDPASPRAAAANVQTL